jgi:hypothetical protein
MPLLNSDLYDALREAGVSEDKARAAASSVAAYDARLAEITGELKLTRWMVTFNLGLTVAVLMLMLRTVL